MTFMPPTQEPLAPTTTVSLTPAPPPAQARQDVTERTEPHPPRPSSRAHRQRPPARRPRRWIPYLGAIFLVTLLIWGLWPQPAPVELAQVQTGSLRVTVNEEGKTRIRQRYVVSAPV